MKFVVGIDEAGRGPLAGPVAVAAVLVAEGFEVAREFPGVRDSKKLTEEKREEIFNMLEARDAEGVARFAVRFSSAELIDERGMTIAVKRALQAALATLAPLPFDGRVLLDGSLFAPSDYVQETIIGGDGSEPLIALASIAAKVSRDRLMKKLAKEYPEYGFEAHKGYGTKAHYAALAELGPSPAHRRTFLHL